MCYLSILPVTVENAESVAQKILEAVETQAAEVYAENLKKALL